MKNNIYNRPGLDYYKVMHFDLKNASAMYKGRYTKCL